MARKGRRQTVMSKMRSLWARIGASGGGISSIARPVRGAIGLTAQPPNPANPPNTANRRSRVMSHLVKSGKGGKEKRRGQAENISHQLLMALVRWIFSR